MYLHGSDSLSFAVPPFSAFVPLPSPLICLPHRTCVWFLNLPPSLPPTLLPPSLLPSVSALCGADILREGREDGWFQAAGRSRVLVRPLHQSGTDAHLLPRRPGVGVAGGVALVVTHVHQRKHDNVTCKRN